MTQARSHSDIAIAGAGLIGLTLALALRDAGATVTVFSAADPLTGSSHAAAGMLAVEDPHNPPELLPLSRLSRSLYPDFLRRLENLSALAVTPQTTRTLQEVPAPASSTTPSVPGLPLSKRDFAELDEWSLDPRELASSLHHAIAPAGIRLLPHTPLLSLTEHTSHVLLESAHQTETASHFIDCTGAWSLSSRLVPEIAVRPRKGQMLTVCTPPSLRQTPVVLRTEHLYIVPRVHGPSAGQTLIGASVEDAGFDLSLSDRTLGSLHEHAAALLPELSASAEVQRWAGLRPATADALPLLGRLPRHTRCFIASGHFRNGILLAPGTAQVMTDLIQGRQTAVDLRPFRPGRFVEP